MHDYLCCASIGYCIFCGYFSWLLIFVFLVLGGWWRWAVVSPDGVEPSQIVCVSASVNLPLRHKVQKFSSGTG